MTSTIIPRRSSSLIYLVPVEWLKGRNYNFQNHSSFNYKLLLLERNGSSKSFAKSSTFPGGALEAIDGQLGDEDKVCAIRESFEEAGFLVCKEKVVRDHVIKKDYWRNMVHNDSAQFKQMLSQYNLTLDLDSLIPYQRWITPEQAPSRFDTKFYISNPKSEQDFDFDISHDGTENTNSVWMSPDEAISNFVQEKILLAPPTYCILNHLCKYQNWEDILNDSLKNVSDFDQPILPIMINNKDKTIKGVYGERIPKQLIILPGDCLYNASSSFGVPHSYHRLEIYGPNDYSLIEKRESKL